MSFINFSPYSKKIFARIFTLSRRLLPSHSYAQKYQVKITTHKLAKATAPIGVG